MLIRVDPQQAQRLYHKGYKIRLSGGMGVPSRWIAKGDNFIKFYEKVAAYTDYIKTPSCTYHIQFK